MRRIVCTVALILLTLAWARAALAAEVREVEWSDLLPEPSAEVNDPFAALTRDQVADLGLLVRIRRFISEGRSVPDGPDARELRRIERSLAAAGIDVEGLLEQRPRVRDARERRARSVARSLDGRVVRLPGYVLPLERSGDRVTSFLLVPYIGVCIHTPPPPPNQVVRVACPQGLRDKGRFAPVWVGGRIQAHPTRNDLFLVDGSGIVASGYVMDAGSVEDYSAAESDALARAAVVVRDPDHTWLQALQMRVSARFAQVMTDIRDRQSVLPLLFGLLVAFAYGVLHTLGPGHGKGVVLSYFVGEGGTMLRGMRLGTQIAVYHVLSALVVAVLAELAIRHVTGGAPSDFLVVRLASYAVIALIGGAMLVRAIGSSRHGCPGDPSHTTCGCLTATRRRGREAGLALAVGVVPCTGALLVLLYGMANDLLWPSILLVASISLGMAVALSGIGVLAILGRRVVERGLASQSGLRHRVLSGLRITGAAAVLALGLALFTFALAGGFAAPVDWRGM